MTEHIVFLLLGLGNGAVYAALGMALVVTFRSSGVVNFSTGAIALYTAYTYAFLRRGELFVPIPGLPTALDLGAPLTAASATAVSLVIAALLGLLLYLLVFRPLRNTSAVAKAVASIGVMLVLTALLAARIGTTPVSVEAVLPDTVYEIGDGRVPADRLWFAAIIVLLGIALTVLVRKTRFGLATRAVAETERGAIVSGLSPDRIAAMNWALSAAVAGISGILIAPIVPLTPNSYTLFIVPALAAAMVGGFSKLGPAILAGLAIGMVQSDMTYLQTTVDAWPASGTAELVPLVLILVLLVTGGQRLPQRGEVSLKSLGRSPRPGNLWLPLVIGLPIAALALVLTDGSWRAAVITTFVLGIISLSQVVITGYAGQVSLAQFAIAGASAFLLSNFTTDLGIPFPLAPLLATVIATALGVVVGLPALRMRGLAVAVVTLALAVALEAFWFRNPELNGGLEGAPIATPKLFGVDFGIGAGEGYPRLTFGFLALAVLTLIALGVALLRRSRLGASMLAVRANERSAAASGIDVPRVKLAAFAIAAAIAAIGGSLLGYQQNVASPTTYAALAGIGLFATGYLCGITSVSGGLLAGIAGAGGVLFLSLERLLHLGEYFAMFSGILLVLTVVLNPEGIVGPLHEKLRRRRGRNAGDVSFTRNEDTQLEIAALERREPGEEILHLSEIGVTYGAVVAVDDVSLSVRDGEILGLIGPNGAGKTTFIDGISGFTRSTGSVRLEEKPLEKRPPHKRSRDGLGRTFQGIELYDDLTVKENVLVGTTAAAVRPDDAEIDKLFELLDLVAVRERPVSGLSQGQRQLVSVARALAGRPRVVLLDEPAAGLDSDESRWLGERLRAVCNSGVTVVMIEHDMGLVLETCDRVAVLDLGKLIALGSPEEVKSHPDVVRAYLGNTHTRVDPDADRLADDKTKETVS